MDTASADLDETWSVYVVRGRSSIAVVWSSSILRRLLIGAATYVHCSGFPRRAHLPQLGKFSYETSPADVQKPTLGYRGRKPIYFDDTMPL